MLAPKELFAIHPLGKSPVISDNGVVIAESGAITEYLIKKYGKEIFKNAKADDELKCSYWSHYAEGSLMPPLLLHLIFGRLSKEPMPLVLRPFGALIGGGVLKAYIIPQLKRHLSFIENELGDSSFFLGEVLSGADIQMSFPLEAANNRMGFEKYPKLKKYLERIHARPAYQRALEKGGAFTI